jgi:hypothetical protein
MHNGRFGGTSRKSLCLLWKSLCLLCCCFCPDANLSRGRKKKSSTKRQKLALQHAMFYFFPARFRMNPKLQEIEMVNEMVNGMMNGWCTEMVLEFSSDFSAKHAVPQLCQCCTETLQTVSTLSESPQRRTSASPSNLLLRRFAKKSSIHNLSEMRVDFCVILRCKEALQRIVLRIGPRSLHGLLRNT